MCIAEEFPFRPLSYFKNLLFKYFKNTSTPRGYLHDQADFDFEFLLYFQAQALGL